MATAQPRHISAREAAFLVLLQVEREAAYANLALAKLMRTYQLSAADARLAAEIVYGAARLRDMLDHIIAALLAKPIEQLMPEARVILRLSLYQLRALDKVTPYAVVDEAVKLAKQYANPPIARLVNGVLRNYLRRDAAGFLPRREDDLVAYLSVTLSYPRWLVDLLLREAGAEAAEQFCLAGNSHPGLFLRANTLRLNRDQLAARLAAEGLVAAPAGYAPETLLLKGGNIAASRAFRDGDCSVQGAASQLAAHALSPAPGSRALDLCAAPGGKTTHLAALMQDRGELHAFDRHAHKIGLIKDNCRRLGINMVQAADADSRQLGPAYRNWADYLLLDAPCSGLGVLAARPDSRYHLQEADIERLALAAAELLQAAADYVKPGGLLCFSTCTVTRRENREQIERFLAARGDFRLQPLSALLPWLSSAADRQTVEQGMLQLWPDVQGGEGFFISLMRKHG